MLLAPPNQERASTRLRRMMARKELLWIPGCFNAMSGRVLEHLGFEAIYMSGYGTSLSLTGLPDVGLVTETEMVLNARYIAQSVQVPLICDSDTAFGNAINVVRTVRDFIVAGVAGIHIEDQVSPKRCGHVAGREVIDIEEAAGKIRAADAIRKQLDPDFVIIARTDARGAHKGTLDDAIARGNAYMAAGADMIFVEGPTSVDEVRRICKEIKGPIFYNMTGISPRFTREEMQELGVAVCITAGTLMRAALMAMYDVGVRLRDVGPMAEKDFIDTFNKHPMGDIHTFAGFNEVRQMEEMFMPANVQDKYSDSIGHMPAPSKTK